MGEALRTHVGHVTALIYDESLVLPVLSGEPDLALLSVLGRHHWLRFSATPAGAPLETSRHDLAVALDAFGTCFLAADDISELPLSGLTMLVETVMTDPVATLCELEGVAELEPERELALLQRTLFATPPLSPRFKLRGVRLAAVLNSRFQATGDPAFLDMLVTTLAEIRPHRPSDPQILAMSGMALHRRHRDGDRHATDLDEALALLREALPELTEGSATRKGVVCALADLLGENPDRVTGTSETDDLVAELRALEADPKQREYTEELSGLILGLLALSPAPDSGTVSDILARLRSLAMSSSDEEALGMLDALTEVQAVLDIDIDAVPDDELASVIERAADVVTAAGFPGADGIRSLSLSLRGSEAMTVEDLDSAVSLLDEALRITTAEATNPGQYEAIAAQLALALLQRYQRRGDPLDRERVAALGRTLRPDLKVEQTSSTTDVIAPPGLFAARSRQVESETEAILGMLAAAAAHHQPSADSDVVTGFLLRYGDFMHAQLTGEGDPADRINAVDRELARMDEALASETDPWQRTMLELTRLLARSVRSMIGDRFGDLAELTSDARRYMDTHELPERLHKSLGLFIATQDQLGLLLHRYRQGPESARVPPERADRALTDAARVSADPSFGPGRRITAAHITAQLAVHAQRPQVAALALADAVRLLPHVASAHVRPDRRERHFAQFTGVTGDAAALALSTGSEPVEALRLLETGRSVLQTQVMGTRIDLKALREAAPRLAAEYEDLVTRLTADDSEGGETPGWRHSVAEEHKRVTAAIRALNGFADFAGPPSASSLTAASGEGPIITLNLSEFGCDALIARPDGVTRLPLNITHTDAVTQVNAFVSAIDGLFGDPGFAAARKLHGRIRDVLTWVNERITGPVLDLLELPETAPENCPRVWWAPGGILGLLPLHAAGDYHATRPVITADRVISSYTPTIRHLMHSQDHTRTTGPLRGFAAAVGDGDPPLPHARMETEALPPYFTERLHDADAGRQAVLDLLSRRELAHFACHGLSVPTDPSTARVLLGGESLTVADVTGLNLGHAKLAYLSACRTAQNTAADLIDESLHLAAAFQVAGFPHVVATMWPIGDAAALAFSCSFYHALGPGPDVSRSAHAVHVSMLEARKSLPTAPHLWGAWIHYGA